MCALRSVGAQLDNQVILVTVSCCCAEDLHTNNVSLCYPIVYVGVDLCDRGICYFFLEVECASMDLHSGVFGGTV